MRILIETLANEVNRKWGTEVSLAIIYTFEKLGGGGGEWLAFFNPLKHGWFLDRFYLSALHPQQKGLQGQEFSGMGCLKIF